jgi:hypothetical protein
LNSRNAGGAEYAQNNDFIDELLSHRAIAPIARRAGLA